MALPGRRAPLIAALCVWPLAVAASDAPNEPVSTSAWTFRVLLDGQPIGEHRFRLSGAREAERTLVSEAQFTVRWLGIALYRYQHRAVERWRGDCLAALSADTDDNGTRTQVSAQAQDAQFDVTAPAPQSARGCVMSFAYWHPALRTQQRLLNAQTGRIEPVRITLLGEAPLEQGARSVLATGWRIHGPGAADRRVVLGAGRLDRPGHARRRRPRAALPTAMTERAMNRRLAPAYAITLVVFLALDAVWLLTMYERLYRPAIGHLLRDGFAIAPAAAFYALYILGVVVFAVLPGQASGRASVAAARGALFGLIAYATYDLTNQATLRDWPWQVTMIDLVWGAFASAVAAGAACRAVLARPQRA